MTGLPRGTILGLLLAIAVVSGAGCLGNESSGGPIVIGYLGGISGKSSSLGIAGRDGALLAVEEMNAAGGVNGRSVVLEVADDEAGEGAAAAGVRALAEKGARVIVGPFTSAAAVEAAPVADELGVALLSPTVSSTDFTGKDDYFLRTCSDNQLYAVELAADAAAGGARSVAFALDDSNASYTHTLAQHYEEAFVALGGSVTTTEAFESGEGADLAGAATRVVASTPDSVFLIANPIDSGLLCQHLRNQGYGGKILLAQWSVSNEDLIRTGGHAVDDATFLDNYDRNSVEPAYTAMADAFRARYSYAPPFAAVHGYDAAKMAAQAIAKVPEDGSVKDVLLTMGPWAALQDAFELDRFGDTVRPFYPMRIENGEFVTVGDS